MKTLARMLILGLLFVAPSTTRAQGVSPAGFSRLAQPRDSNTVQRRDDFRFATRTLTAAVGGTAGAFGLGIFAANSAPGCGGCESPGLREFIGGFAIGGVVGAGLGAAIPRLGKDNCSFNARMWRALGGAAVGSVTGGLLGSRIGETSLVVGWAIGTAIGGPVALIGC